MKVPAKRINKPVAAAKSSFRKATPPMIHRLNEVFGPLVARTGALEIQRYAEMNPEFVTHDPDNGAFSFTSDDLLFTVSVDMDVDCKLCYRGTIESYIPGQQLFSVHRPTIDQVLHDLSVGYANLKPTKLKAVK